MPTPTIPNGEEHFFTTIYEGNGAGQRVGKFVPFTDNGTIANSLMFERDDSPRLNRTPSGTGTSTRIYTLSVWAKPTVSSSASHERFIITAGPYGNSDSLVFKDNRIIQFWINGTVNASLKTNRTFEDSSKFYHILVAVDTTQSTASDRIKMYIDGDQITSFSTENYPSQNYDGHWGTAVSTSVGSSNSPNRYMNGYLAEVNYVDGTALGPDTFGVTDTSTGRWIPKTLTGITYGTNGFRLQFGSSSALGEDTSGNGNDFSVTNLVASDQTTDSPTQNHATLSPHSAYKSSNFTLSEGNLKATSTSTSGTHSGQGGMRIPNGGKYYWECEIDAGKDGMGIGIIPTDTPTTSANPSTATLYLSNGSMRTNGSNAISYGSGVSNGDIMGFALDLSNPSAGKLYVSVNGTYENSGNPVTGVNPAPANPLTGDFRVIYQDGSNGYAPVYIYNFGQKSFAYTPPTGFVALQQDNLPETAKGVSGLVWIKDRDSAYNHVLYDSSRGPRTFLYPNGTQAEQGENGSAYTNLVDGVQKFLKGGFSIEDQVNLNASGNSYVSWNWVANGGTTASNGDGSISSTVQVNQTAGFSIVKWTSTGSNATVGHGLSTAPSFILGKVLTRTDNWIVGHHKTSATPWNNATFLSVSNSQYTSAAYWNNTAPTSTVFTTGTWWYSSEDYIAYCWHEVDGFSKFGKYTGNGSADGPFVYTGFRPAWIMIKNAGATASWFMLDAARNTFNPVENWLVADDPQAEVVTSGDRKIDFLSNGFKIRATTTDFNGSSANMIYMAFAEHPFVGDGTSPVTAR